MHINNFHFHLYYPFEKINEATEVLNKLREEKVGIPIGRIWDRPVGPHPIGSCQVTVEADQYYEMIQWFLINRNGFSLFIHPDTGDDLADHTDYVMWMGKEHPLKIEQFKKKS